MPLPPPGAARPARAAGRRGQARAGVEFWAPGPWVGWAEKLSLGLAPGECGSVSAPMSCPVCVLHPLTASVFPPWLSEAGAAARPPLCRCVWLCRPLCVCSELCGFGERQGDLGEACAKGPEFSLFSWLGGGAQAPQTLDPLPTGPLVLAGGQQWGGRGASGSSTPHSLVPPNQSPPPSWDAPPCVCTRCPSRPRALSSCLPAPCPVSLSLPSPVPVLSDCPQHPPPHSAPEEGTGRGG